MQRTEWEGWKEGEEGGVEVEEEGAGGRCRVSPGLLVFSGGPRIKKGAPRGAANYRLDLKWIFLVPFFPHLLLFLLLL